jgi:hypothetical protein
MLVDSINKMHETTLFIEEKHACKNTKKTYLKNSLIISNVNTR